jgi:orotidine-5'-phosphate decarboxylase
MTTQELVQQIRNKKSFLCIGLDVDLAKIPQHLLASEDPIFEFNKAIIDATHDLCVSYKPNTAFYEAYGLKGLNTSTKNIRKSSPLPMQNAVILVTLQPCMPKLFLKI